MDVQIAVAKIHKYAVSLSGDTVEVIERPQGGLSAVMADGQSSGRGAKAISSMVVRKVITLLADGVRDGAAARAASDYLFSERNGKVSATLNILSVDLQTNTLVFTRNNPCPLILAYGDEIKVIDEDSKPIGIYRDTRPVIIEIPIQAGVTAVAFTDGLVHAGSRTNSPMNSAALLESLLTNEDPSPQLIADSLLNYAITLDQGRPADDMTVVVMRVTHRGGDEIRRMAVRLPIGA